MSLLTLALVALFDVADGMDFFDFGKAFSSLVLPVDLTAAVAFAGAASAFSPLSAISTVGGI